MQSARRPLTRDASGPGFRSVEPHRFRSAAQPTTTAAAAAVDLPLPPPPFVVHPVESTENPLSKSQCQRLVTVTTRIAVSSTRRPRIIGSSDFRDRCSRRKTGRRLVPSVDRGSNVSCVCICIYTILEIDRSIVATTVVTSDNVYIYIDVILGDYRRILPYRSLRKKKAPSC